ncbi:iron-sulfur cluster assembly scaffold protein [Sphingomonas xanthus]|uniref:Iron-sulfur cluster assembly scaffold protein n=1 Tax=Sphingomonas xanthus TaxID=2594473 RepID=A0A516IT91_9SPHN|nr:iron-sulfur cluster assembly scaffold protein [Sphingomonas xanthus]QDP20119.1 iron-sulfur cluster assembly scaffold protein [Sphingomonas xanthus]
MTAPLYTRDILRLAANIPGQRGFDELNGDTETRSPTCGSRMRVAVELNGAGQVVALTQAVEACAFGQAAAALMGRSAQGRTRTDIETAIGVIEAWLDGDDAAGDGWPGIAALEPVRRRKGRHGAVLLPFRALLAAMERR